jgi:PTS system nitrogen regulatory IIA component
MQLRELLRPELIKVPLEAETREEAITELIDLLVQHHEVPMARRHSIVEEFRAHSHGGGTALYRGLAMPHVDSDHVEDFICALGISHEGVPFGGLDDKPAKVILLALAPKKSLAAEIETLAELERELDRHLLGQLTEARSGQDVFNLLKGVSASA